MKLLNLWISTHKKRFFGEDGAELKEQLGKFCSDVSPKGDSLMALLGRLVRLLSFSLCCLVVGPDCVAGEEDEEPSHGWWVA